MNKTQKENITKMRQSGLTFHEISSALSLSLNTVKSYCRRSGICPLSSTSTATVKRLFCKQCGQEITQKSTGRTKLFCSNACRQEWWKKHQDQIAKKAYYTAKCAYCHKPFTVYGNNHRKFCSHACYINARFHLDTGLAIDVSKSVNTVGTGEEHDANTQN